MVKVTDEVVLLAKLLWEYQRLNEHLEAADVIIALGCEDIRVAERAVGLYLAGYGKWLVCTGRYSSRTENLLKEKGFPSEATYFASVAKKAGVDPEHILLEDRATNSVENAVFTKQLLSDNHIDAKRIIVVSPPYSERRQKATYAAQWPEQIISITSPQLAFETYPTSELSMEYLINALVGRVQRMKVYAEKGFQLPTEIPLKVWRACERLMELGFTEQTVK